MAIPVNIYELINRTIVESTRVEFKADWNPEAILHTICAFANDIDNMGGGYIVVGVEEDCIWIADTIITGTKVTRYERNVESFSRLGKESFQYFMLMDDEYKIDGNYTPMW